MKITKSESKSEPKTPFGEVEGQTVDLYTLENDNGVTVKITNYGGTVTSIVTPDKHGNDRYLVPDDTNVPVGEEATVAGTACDFNHPKRIGEAFDELPMGFEHFYAFRGPVGSLEKVAEVSEPTSGRKLEVLTSEPGMLFYTSDSLKRESGAQFGQFRAFCLETSKYPNGPNIDGAPNSVLHPGETYDETTIYKLSWA